MRKIFKYRLKEADEQTIQMPKGYQILNIINQKDTPMLYALVSPNNELEDVEIISYGTGHIFDESKEQKYIGTITLYNDEFVLHFFEAVKEEEVVASAPAPESEIETSVVQALKDTEKNL